MRVADTVHELFLYPAGSTVMVLVSSFSVPVKPSSVVTALVSASSGRMAVSSLLSLLTVTVSVYSLDCCSGNSCRSRSVSVKE